MSNKKADIFRIPAPFPGEEDFEYYPLVRIGRIVPFGYAQDPNDPDILLPVEEELRLLEAAKRHLKHYSLRDVSAWLSAKSGRSISHSGLQKRIQAEQLRAREYLDARQLAKKFRDAYHKARKLEAGRLGKRVPTEEELDDELYTGLDETIRG